MKRLPTLMALSVVVGQALSSMCLAQASPPSPQAKPSSAPAPAPPAAAWTGKTLRVPDSFPTIKDAMAAAQPGDTILLAPRKHTEAVILRSKVRLRGESATLTVLEGATESQGVLFASGAEGFAVENLTIAGGHRTLEKYKPWGMFVEDSSGTLSDVRFVGFGQVGLCVRGKAAGVVATGSQWQHGDTGILVDGGAQAAVERLSISHCSAGAQVEGAGSRLSLLNGAVSECKFGVVSMKSSDLVCDGVTFTSASDSSILVSDAAATVSQSSFDRTAGLRVGPKGTATVSNSKFDACEPFSLAVQGDGASLTSKENQFNRPAANAIVVSAGAKLESSRDRAQDGAQSAILAFGTGTSAIIKDGAFSSFVHAAVRVHEEATADIQGCTFENNTETAIGITGSAAGSPVTIKGNTIRNGKRSGIALFAGARAHVEKNTCTGNRENGISVLGVGTDVTLKGNICHTNTQAGIMVFRSAKCVAEGNTCERNKQSGISVSEEKTHATLKKNTCRENEHHGIEFFEQGGGLADGNTCESNGWSGIGILDKGTAPAVRNNKCAKNKGWGIVVGKEAKPKLEGGNSLLLNEKGTLKRDG